MVKQGNYSRSVSIVGIGCTGFGDNQNTPGREHLTEGDMFGYAALTAMEDAGLQPRDIDYFYTGSVNPMVFSDIIEQSFNVCEDFGMHYRGSINHDEACCTGYAGLELAVKDVASGVHDIVLSGGVQMACSAIQPGMPAPWREDYPMEKLMEGFDMAYDTAYTRMLGGGVGYVWDGYIHEYATRYGVSPEDIDRALNRLAYDMRRAGKLNPLAHVQDDYDDLAAAHGMANGMEYLNSPMNPLLTQYLRASSIEIKSDGAAAVIVCTTEIAKKLVETPIEVLGIGAAAAGIIHPYFERIATDEALRQVYELTGMSGKDLDLFFPNDCELPAQIVAAEAAGYVPEGEGWKYAIDGRFAFDGDKPLATHGGRTSFGHAHAASGFADIGEVVKQMRGTAGETQIKKIPKTALIRGFCAQNARAVMLRTVE